MQFNKNEYHKNNSQRKTNDETLGTLVKRMIEFYGLKGGLNETRVRACWFNTMGPTIGKYTKKITVHKGKLFIRITAASLRQELSFAKEKIKRIMNEEVGEDYIKEVIIL